MRRERRIHECFPEGKHLIKLFSKDDCVADVSESCTQKQISQRVLKVTDFNVTNSIASSGVRTLELIVQLVLYIKDNLGRKLMQ